MTHRKKYRDNRRGYISIYVRPNLQSSVVVVWVLKSKLQKLWFKLGKHSYINSGLNRTYHCFCWFPFVHVYTVFGSTHLGVTPDSHERPKSSSRAESGVAGTPLHPDMAHWIDTLHGTAIFADQLGGAQGVNWSAYIYCLGYRNSLEPDRVLLYICCYEKHVTYRSMTSFYWSWSYKSTVSCVHFCASAPFQFHSGRWVPPTARGRKPGLVLRAVVGSSWSSIYINFSWIAKSRQNTL